VGIGIIAFLVAVLVAYALRPRRIAAGGIIAWLVITGVLAKSGVLARFDARPPPLVVVLVIGVVLGITAGFSRMAKDVPLAALVGLQAFRFPLELCMHEAAREGVMPPQMSFGEYNFDIVTGITAIGVAFLVARNRAPRWLVAAWNAMGFLLVLVVMAIGVASTPMIHAFGTSPARVNTFIAYFPYVWLPAILVTTAIASHITIARRLLAMGAPAISVYS
jgi:hypothetical protein